MVNQNETNQKVAAAVTSNTMPDALDMGLDLLLLLSNQNQLVPLDDLYAKIGKAHGGWLKSVDVATDPKLFNGTRNGIPYGTSGNVLFRRTDVLTKAGITDRAEDLDRCQRRRREDDEVADLRHGLRALECRRRQYAGAGDAVVGRPGRRRRGQGLHDQVAGDEGVPPVGDGCLQ